MHGRALKGFHWVRPFPSETPGPQHRGGPPSSVRAYGVTPPPPQAELGWGGHWGCTIPPVIGPEAQAGPGAVPPQLRPPALEAVSTKEPAASKRFRAVLAWPGVYGPGRADSWAGLL